jgi:hypothetical protein
MEGETFLILSSEKPRATFTSLYYCGCKSINEDILLEVYSGLLKTVLSYYCKQLSHIIQ